MSLPVPGQLSWGLPLNAYINNVVLADALQALSAVNAHVAGTDPHGDRAYANSLVAPIFAGVNLPNGFVQLGPTGVLPSSIMPPSVITQSHWDAVQDFSVPNTGASSVSALQTALNAVATAGGGELWLPDGTYVIDTKYLVVGANTWLHLSPGATMVRKNPGPAYMVTNVDFALGTAIPSASNIKISGGTWDATNGGTVAGACTMFWFGGASRVVVEDLYATVVNNNPMVEFNGASLCEVRNVTATGSGYSAPNAPLIRLNDTKDAPAGLGSAYYATNKNCDTINIDNVKLWKSGANWAVMAIVDDDIRTNLSGQHLNVHVVNCSSSGNGSNPATGTGVITAGPHVGDYPGIGYNAAVNQDIQIFAAGNNFPGFGGTEYSDGVQYVTTIDSSSHIVYEEYLNPGDYHFETTTALTGGVPYIRLNFTGTSTGQYCKHNYLADNGNITAFYDYEGWTEHFPGRGFGNYVTVDLVATVTVQTGGWFQILIRCPSGHCNWRWGSHRRRGRC